MPSISWSAVLSFGILFGSFTLHAAEPQSLQPATNASKLAPIVIRSTQSGRWSETTTWESGRVPEDGDIVSVAPGHKVIYDVVSKAVIRSLHLDGALQFAPDCDTRLEVGLIRVGAGGTTDEQGFDCTAVLDSTSHHASHQSNAPRAELLVGLPEHIEIKNQLNM